MYENEIQSIAARESDAEIYAGLLQLTKDIAKQKGQIQGKKKLYYISAEFLIGKLLSNNLINLGIYDQVANALKEHGKSLAQIMFFNGLCRTAARGPINSLPNEYLADNLAFSFQLQLMANEYYPGLARRIYLKGYRYNMHLCPKSLLVEVGAQTNTKEEAYNAMEPLADILDKVLK